MSSTTREREAVRPHYAGKWKHDTSTQSTDPKRYVHTRSREKKELPRSRPGEDIKDNNRNCNSTS